MTVSANLFVDTNPSVLSAGGADLVLSGLFLTNSVIPPIGTVQQFSDSTAVQNYFGAGSNEVTAAQVYFAGWSNSLQKPANIIFAQYPSSAVAAYLRGGNISALPLATLQGYNGTLTVVLDGATYTGSVNLSGATSFSNAATLIQTALNTSPPTESTFTGAISSTTLTLSGPVTGVPLSVGHVLAGGGTSANTQITAIVDATHFTVNNSQSSNPTTATATVVVTYASTQGAFKIKSGIVGASSTAAYPTTNALATNLLLTAATAAVLSQGAAAAIPAGFMNGLINTFTNFATFATLFNPDVSGFANKELFSQWTDGTNGRFLYSAWDIDATAGATLPATSSFGYWLQQNAPEGTVPNWAPDATNAMELSAFFMGVTASIDFEQVGGRITYAGKGSGQLTPTVTDNTTFENLAGNPQADGSFGNGYNCYAAIATANANFQWYQRSTISGSFKWADVYVNSIWLTNTFQVALMSLMGEVNRIPINAAGAGMIRTALMPTILQAGDFGAYDTGVTLSGSQVASANASAGFDIATPLANNGWFLLIRPASASVRENRGPWQIVFYFTDAGAVQSLTLSTVALI